MFRFRFERVIWAQGRRVSIPVTVLASDRFEAVDKCEEAVQPYAPEGAVEWRLLSVEEVEGAD